MKLNRYLICILILLITISGCTPQEPEHKDLSPDSPNILSFNYKLYEMPPVGELGHFEFTISLLDLNYMGEKAEIQFKSTNQYQIDETPIKFVFQDKSENFRIKITPLDLSKPVDIIFTGKIITSNETIPFKGSLLTNRDIY